MFFSPASHAQDATLAIDTLPIDTQTLIAQTRAAQPNTTAPDPAAPAAPSEPKPQPIMQHGMKFIPIDRKKALTRPISKNQPAIIRPRSPVVNRNMVRNHKDAKESNSIRIDNNAPAKGANTSGVTNSGDVLSVFPIDEAKP